MRVAIFTEVFLPKIDGITNRLRHTIRCLLEDGHTVQLFVPRTAVARYPGVRVVQIPGVPFRAYPEIQYTLPHPRVLSELMRFAPEVVHVVGPATMGVWGTMAARALGIPLVSSFHTDFPKYLADYGLGWGLGIVWPLLRTCHNAARINLCPSRATAHELIAHGIRRVGLWRGGVDTEQFSPALRSRAMRRRLAGGREDRPILLFVGRLGSEKNLESLEHVFTTIPDARLALVGDGPGRAALERHFAGRPVIFTGFLRGAALGAAFASADLFVMPSRTETLGFVALEAMSAGLPVVAARAGGLPELVEHERNGLLYDAHAGDAGARLAAAARRMLDDAALRERCVLEGRALAERTGWRGETRGLVEQYRRAIAGQGPRAQVATPARARASARRHAA